MRRMRAHAHTHTHLKFAMGRVTSVTILHHLVKLVCKPTTWVRMAHLGTCSTSMKLQALPCCHAIDPTRTWTPENQWLGAPYFLPLDNEKGVIYGERLRPHHILQLLVFSVDHNLPLRTPLHMFHTKISQGGDSSAMTFLVTPKVHIGCVLHGLCTQGAPSHLPSGTST